MPDNNDDKLPLPATADNDEEIAVELNGSKEVVDVRIGSNALMINAPSPIDVGVESAAPAVMVLPAMTKAVSLASKSKAIAVPLICDCFAGC